MTPIQVFGAAVVGIPTVILLICCFCIWYRGSQSDAAKMRKLTTDTVNKRFIDNLIKRTLDQCSARALQGYYDCKIDYREELTFTKAEDRIFVDTLLDMGYRVSDYGNGTYTVRW